MDPKNIHFLTPYNFGSLPEEKSSYENSKAVILPVPYDGTATYRPGARFGPRAIITASKYLDFYDDELKKNFSDIGICTLDELEVSFNPEETAESVYESVKRLAEDKKFPIVFGGEHSITFGAVKALKEKFPDLGVLHLDAHADVRANEKLDHSNVARKILELCPVSFAGIRSISVDEAEFIEENKIKIFSAREIMEKRDFRGIISHLPENIYITIDLDVLDPSIMPSVGTPQPGGIGWYELIDLLKSAAKEKNIVGFDIVELCPSENISPDFLSAKLAYKMIGYKFYK